jgi:hypothetical protein
MGCCCQLPFAACQRCQAGGCTHREPHSSINLLEASRAHSATSGASARPFATVNLLSLVCPLFCMTNLIKSHSSCGTTGAFNNHTLVVVLLGRSINNIIRCEQPFDIEDVYVFSACLELVQCLTRSHTFRSHTFRHAGGVPSPFVHSTTYICMNQIAPSYGRKPRTHCNIAGEQGLVLL